jgi:hypothetical protein
MEAHHVSKSVKWRARKRVKLYTILLGILLAHGVIGTTTTAVQAQSELTLDNFAARYTAKGLVGVNFGPFNCGPDIFDRSDTFCFNEVSSGSANIAYRGSTSSRVLTYTSVLVYNPDNPSQSGLFLGLGIRMVSTLSPELNTDAMMQMLIAITKVPNSERRVGPWVYRIERRPRDVALHAQRK